jgi:F-type H+-transporting ATPase subunit a
VESNPLALDVIAYLGPVPISRAVLTTWGIMALLTLVSWLGLRRAQVRPGTLQTVLEVVVETLEQQTREVIRRDPWPYLPLLGTLFIFLVLANLAAIVPGMKPPTGRIETPMALALVVFFSVHYFGVRSRGLRRYLLHYTKPNLALLPLNVLSEITRTFSLMVRLFGNIMSHELIIAIVVVLAGLLVPIPFMLLGILIGLIQAYIFTVLATVFIAAGVDTGEQKREE